MEKFENVFVGFMFKQAAMPFFLVGAYNEPEGELAKFISEVRDYEMTWKNAAKRVERGMRVPNTWRKKLQSSEVLVSVLERKGMIPQDWADNHYRAQRFMKQY